MRITTLAAIVLLGSCNSQNNSSPPLSFADSLEIEMKADSMAKALVAETTKNALFDTAGLHESPVKVTSAKLINREYSNYKDIRLTFKNVSDKRIEGIRFRWYGETVFGDPADMGNGVQEGFGGGFDDTPLGPGKASSGTWSILSRNGKKVILAWPYEVVFADGTKWEL